MPGLELPDPRLVGRGARGVRNSDQFLRGAALLLSDSLRERTSRDLEIADAQLADLEGPDTSAPDGEPANGERADRQRAHSQSAAGKGADGHRSHGAAVRRREFVLVRLHRDALPHGERADPRPRSSSNALRARSFTQSRHKPAKAQAA